MASEADGCATIVGVIILAVVAFFVIVYVVLPGVAVILGVGAAWGGGHSIVNYLRALYGNIELEKPSTI